MKYDFSDQVSKTIDQMDDDAAKNMFSKIMALPEFGDIKPLEGRHAGLSRLRVGDWRVIFAEEDDTVLVGYILPPAGAGSSEGGAL